MDARDPASDRLRRSVDHLAAHMDEAPVIVVAFGQGPDDMRMARAVGSLGIGIESTVGTRDDLMAAGASAVYPGVAEFVDDLLGPP